MRGFRVSGFGGYWFGGLRFRIHRLGGSESRVLCFRVSGSENSNGKEI